MADERPLGGIGGATRKTGIIGWPVEHSLSPAIHNAAFEVLGLDWVYVPLAVPPGMVPQAIAGLPALGFTGANVTMPHKTEVAGLMHSLSDDARRLQAVNTIVVDGERLEGHNTDAPGFERFLRQDAGFDPEGKTALILGAGGAARASALALARAALAGLTVAARDPGKAEGMASALEGLGTALAVVPLDVAGDHPSDLIVNATPVGSQGDVLASLPLEGASVYVDLLYHPAVTPMQLAARRAGVRAFGGMGLLLHQAALSFELWTGRVAPLEVMSAAAVSSLSLQT